MENEPELIRDQMQDTRTALTEKLGALEQHVTNTVKDATTPVLETVQSVTDAVKDTVSSLTDTVQTASSAVSTSVEATVETVKDAFDVPGHVQRHPWLALFGSVAAGFALGRMLGPIGGDSHPPSSTGTAHPGFGAMMADPSAERRDASSIRTVVGGDERKKEEKEDESGGLFSGLLNAYSQEADKLKGLGLAAVFGVVRDLVVQSVPGELGGRLKEWVNGLTQQMGAKPLEEPILGSNDEETNGRGEQDGARAQSTGAAGAPSSSNRMGERQVSPTAWR